MIIPPDALKRTSPEVVSRDVYDAVIVGAGISGAIIANQLAAPGAIDFPLC